MKKAIIAIIALTFVFSSAAVTYASDWDKAGKILTVIEGLRFVSGGNIDVIGGLTDAVHGKQHGNYHYKHKRHHRKHRKFVKRYSCTNERYWVPEYKWKKEWIPDHEEYHDTYGQIHVEGHYIKYQVEYGGHWEYKEVCN